MNGQSGCWNTLPHRTASAAILPPKRVPGAARRRPPAIRSGKVAAPILLLLLGLFLLPAAPLLPHQMGTQQLHAQQTGAVAGTVTDAAGHTPMPAVRISIVDTELSALSDAQGTFRIGNIPVGEVEVRAERLGYRPEVFTVSVAAGETAILEFRLAISAVALDELVVTATGIQRRRELGNATAALNVPRELERLAPVNITSLLQGRATGVQVLQSSGTVGGTASVKIRGNSSVNLSTMPLIYIDGSRVSNNTRSGPGVGGQNTSRLNDLNLDDIESIEIVRGPSAATLYGTDAAGGVIRITTKRGRPGQSQWSFRSDFGANWDATDWPDVVFHPGAFFDQAPDNLYRMNLLRGSGGAVDFGTPWRTGFEQAYGASLTGGMENMTYFVSGEMGHREGSLPNNEATQRSVRGNLSLRPSPTLDLQISSGYGSNEVFMPDNDNNAFGYIGVGALGFPWYMPIDATDPVTGEGGVRTCPLNLEAARSEGVSIATIEADPGWGPCLENPFFAQRTFDDVATLDNQQNIERFTGSATLDYRPAGFLAASATIGYDQFSDQTRQFVPVNPDQPFNELSLGWRAVTNSVNRSLTLEGNVNASFALTGDLRSTTSAGAQFSGRKSESASSVGRVLPPGAKTVSSAVRTEGFESIGEARTMGLFVQQQVALRDRLFVTPAIRFDQNSAFGENLGWEAYPRAMVSYVVSEEDWFPDLPLESLRLRGAWGSSGKQPLGSAALPLLVARRVTFQQQNLSGITLLGPGNDDLKPETGREVELGFEGGLLDGRLGVDFSWFHQTTEDAIVSRALAPSTGYSAPLVTNIGQVKNSGLELGLDVVARNTPGLLWEWRVNWSTVKGEITELGLDEPIIFGLHGDSQRHAEGYPFGSYFSRRYFMGDDGTVQSTEEPEFLGHPTPEYEGSVSTTLTLRRRLTLHADLGFAGGHQQFNSTQEFQCGFLGGGEHGGVCPAIFERDADGRLTDQARIKAQAAEDIQYSPWIEDADFVRLRTVSARFAFPDRWASAVGAGRASFTLVGENLALFTGYSGLDPEINFAGGAQATRAEFLTLPPARRVTGRFAITF